MANETADPKLDKKKLFDELVIAVNNEITGLDLSHFVRPQDGKFDNLSDLDDIDQDEQLELLTSTPGNRDVIAATVTQPVSEVQVNQDAVPVTIENTVILNQSEIQEVGGFVDMLHSPNCWSQAFPTLFPPVLVRYLDQSNNVVERYEVIGEFNPDKSRVRIQSVRDFALWARVLVWQKDSRFANHKTWAFVVHNVSTQKKMQSAGRIALALEPGQSELLISEIVGEKLDALQRKLEYFSSNVTGTESYWGAVWSRVQSMLFYFQHIHKQMVTLFHTGSAAEHHHPALRALLASRLRNRGLVGDDKLAEEILTNDAEFFKAVKSNKHFVSHWFAARTEIWFQNFLYAVHDVEDYFIRFEFAKSRGMIHYHALLLQSGMMATMYKLCGEQLDIVLDRVLEMRETKSPAAALAGLTTTETTEIEQLEIKAAAKLQQLLRSTAGYTANHAGIPHEEMIREKSGLSDALAAEPFGILTNQMVQDTKELQTLKSVRDKQNAVGSRLINFQNMCGTHACNNEYCLREVNQKKILNLTDANVMNNLLDPGILATLRATSGREWSFVEFKKGFSEVAAKLIFGSNIHTGSFVFTPPSTFSIKYSYFECRFGFGIALVFARKGNITGGKKLNFHPLIEYDKNGMIKLVYSRNHPTKIEQPDNCMFWEANCDFRYLLRPTKKVTTMQAVFLQSVGRGGLNPSYAGVVFAHYTCKYSCKAASRTVEFATEVKKLLDAESSTDSAPRTAKHLMMRYMRLICSGRDIPFDEAIYIVSGGQYYKMSRPVKVISMNSVLLDSENVSSTAAFNIINLRNSYFEKQLPNESLYQYACRYKLSPKYRAHIPHFTGLSHLLRVNGAPWPMTEEYARQVMELHVPYSQSVDELAVDTIVNGITVKSFVPPFIKLLREDKLPEQITTNILMAEIGWKDKEGSFETHAAADDIEQLQTANDSLDGLVAVNVDDDDLNIDDIFGADMIFNRVRLGGENCWGNLQLQHYLKYNTWVKDPKPEDMDFEDADAQTLHHPKNARNMDQQSFLASTMLHCNKLINYSNSESQHLKAVRGDNNILLPLNLLPEAPQLNRFVQGKAGVGKSWLVKTDTNIIKALAKHIYNEPGKSVCLTAPTGVAASLIDGETLHRVCEPPRTSKKKANLPSENNVSLSSVARFRPLLGLIMDESSMVPRSLFAWLDIRAHASRTINEDLDPHALLQANRNQPRDPLVELKLWEKIDITNKIKGHEQALGGIPFVTLVMDQLQLPPVADKKITDTSFLVNKDTAISSRAIAAFKIFRNCCQTYVFDIVVRQDRESTWAKFLEELRSGKLVMEHLVYMRTRLLSNLSIDDQACFKRDALYLFPTWKEGQAITREYFDTLKTDDGQFQPIAKCTAQCKRNGQLGVNGKKNHALDKKQCNFPLVTYLARDMKVMLLHNVSVPEKLYNGAFGIIKDIVYDYDMQPNYIPNYETELPKYVLVEFPGSKITNPVDPAQPLLVPIYPVIQYCENRCCEKTQIPLLVGKAITVHKAQGMSIGLAHFFTKMVFTFGPNHSKTPGLVMVALTRAVAETDIAFGDSPSLQEVQNIGHSPTIDASRKYIESLTQQKNETIQLIEKQVKRLSATQEFDDGYRILCEWYDEMRLNDSTVPMREVNLNFLTN